MKKFKTSEDLDELRVRIPVNRARNLLTMCHRAAEDALRVLLKARDAGGGLGPLQEIALQQYVDDYKFLRDAIADAIGTNVSPGDQEVIRDYESTEGAKLKAELAKGYSDRIDKAHECNDPECTTCDAIRKSFKPTKESVEDEFDLSDLPEGTFIVPGSDEEN